MKVELQERFMRWALDVILMCRDLPKGTEFEVIKKQLIRSATSSAANYSASNRGKSKRDMIYKRKIVEEELDESILWLDFLQRLLHDWEDIIQPLKDEADNMLKIIVGSIKSLR
jgi:four helix bundle protein